MEKSIVHTHIPKTAVLSLNCFFQENWGHKNVDRSSCQNNESVEKNLIFDNLEKGNSTKPDRLIFFTEHFQNDSQS